MKQIMLIGLMLFGFFASNLAMADCRCVCMSGEVQAVCSSTLDIQPICAPRICPITPPSVEPIQQPRIPPIGTSNCIQRQVYNEYSRIYEWKEICY